MRRASAVVLVTLCLLLSYCWAGDTSSPIVDLGWLRAIQQEDGWLVIRSYHVSLSGASVSPGDLIVAVDNDRVDGCNAISASIILSNIAGEASTVKVIRHGTMRTLHFDSQQEPLLKLVPRRFSKKRPPSEAKAAVAPSVELPDLAGKLHLINYGPNWTLIHIWSTGCPACWRDIPPLNEISQPPLASVVVIAIAMNDSAETIEEFSKGHPIGFTNLLGGNWDGPMTKAFGPMEFPADVLVDPSGHVAFVGVGSDALRSALERLKELSLR